MFCINQVMIDAHIEREGKRRKQEQVTKGRNFQTRLTHFKSTGSFEIEMKDMKGTKAASASSASVSAVSIQLQRRKTI